MALVQLVHSRWVLDSRGLPTVSAAIVLDNQGRKFYGQSSVPSGASTGTHEALELRDGGQAFHGKGVTKAVENINKTINESLFNQEFASALELDESLLSLDTSSNKSELGANAILAVSMAAHRAFANMFGLELWQYLRRLYFSSLPAVTKFPRLMCNVVNGGAHADSGLSFQEFMVVPNTREIEKDVQIASEVYHTLKAELKKAGQSTALGDEGGFAPHLGGSQKVLEYLQKAIEQAGYTKLDCDLAMDCAASEFYDPKKNIYQVDGIEYDPSGLADLYASLKQDFPNLISIEDGYAEDDIQGWKIMTDKLDEKIHLIGDDLFVTNPTRFDEIGLKNQIANGVLIKLNQIGSVSETCKMINMAKDNAYVTAVSHRSGETPDDFISDLAVASQSEFIKLGAPARGERVAKFNRLLEIFEQLKA
jgi:enolase